MGAGGVKREMGRQERVMGRGEFLAEVMGYKREELARLRREMPFSDVRALAATAPAVRDFASALRQPAVGSLQQPAAGSLQQPAVGSLQQPARPQEVRLIAEVKRASPSKGLLCRDFEPRRLAAVYEAGGAAAISVLTDARFFQGDLAHLAEVREQLSAADAPPVLRKDFIFDPYQVWAARAAGADAVLLIVAALSDHALRDLLAETRRLHMEALVEVHDEQETQRALAAGARIIGINNRDLRTFEVDLTTTERLRPLIPPDVIVAAESGIRTPDDVRRLRALEVDAMLVGETLVRAAPDTRLTRVRELVAAGRAGT